MVDLDAGMGVAQHELGIDRDAMRLDFEIERHFWRAAPFELVGTAGAEIDGAGVEEHLGGGRHQIGDIGVILETQQGNQVRGIQKPQFRCDRTDGIRNDLFTLSGVWAFFHQSYWTRLFCGWDA